MIWRFQVQPSRSTSRLLRCRVPQVALVLLLLGLLQCLCGAQAAEPTPPAPGPTGYMSTLPDPYNKNTLFEAAVFTAHGQGAQILLYPSQIIPHGGTNEVGGMFRKGGLDYLVTYQVGTTRVPDGKGGMAYPVYTTLVSTVPSPSPDLPLPLISMLSTLIASGAVGIRKGRRLTKGQAEPCNAS